MTRAKAQSPLRARSDRCDSAVATVPNPIRRGGQVNSAEGTAIADCACESSFNGSVISGKTKPMQNPKILQHRPSWLSCGNNGGKCSEMRMAQEASPALIRPAGHIAIDRNLAANRSEDAVQSLHNSVSLGGRRLSVHFSATSSLPAAVKRHDLRPISPPHTRFAAKPVHLRDR